MNTRFLCENCNNDVPFDAEICPYCRKLFDAVRCPSCLKVGKPSVFVQGCPKCGYAGVQNILNDKPNKTSKSTKKRKIKKKIKTNDSFLKSGLPFIIILLLIIIILVTFYVK